MCGCDVAAAAAADLCDDPRRVLNHLIHVPAVSNSLTAQCLVHHRTALVALHRVVRGHSDDQLHLAGVTQCVLGFVQLAHVSDVEQVPDAVAVDAIHAPARIRLCS